MIEKLIRGALYILLLAALAPTAPLQAQSALSPAIAGVLYDEDRDPVSGEPGFVTSVASWRNFLYAAWHDLDQRYYLHVWDVSDSRHPVQLQSIYFGQGVDTPSLRFEPKALRVSSAHLLLNVENKLRVYRLSQDGRLGTSSEYAFADGIDSAVAVLSHGGEFGSISRTTISNADFLDAITHGTAGSELDEYLSGYVFMSEQNPEAPFLLRTKRPFGYGYVSYPSPIAGTVEGNPALVEMNDDYTAVLVKEFMPRADAALSDFWESKYGYFFNETALGQSLDALIAATLQEVGAAGLQRRSLKLYGSGLRVPLRRVVGDVIRAKFGARTELAAVLDAYQLSPKMPLGRALRIILEEAAPRAAAERIAAAVYAPVLKSWHARVSAFSGGTLAAAAEGIKSKMNAELDRIGVPRYFAEHVLGPIMNLPTLTSATVDDMVDRLGNTAAAQALDGFLSTFHAVLPSSNFLSTPQCFSIPQSTHDFLRNVFLLNGPKMQGGQPALYELLKLNLYYRGENTIVLGANVGDRLRDLHSALSGDLVRAIFGALGSLDDLQRNPQTLLAGFSNNAAARDAAVLPIAGFIEAQLRRTHLDPNASLESQLAASGLYLNAWEAPSGQHAATVADLVRVMKRFGLAKLRLSDLLARARTRPPQGVKTLTETALRDYVRGVFGPVSSSLTLKEAATLLVTRRLDPAIFGGFISATLDTLLRAGFSDVSGKPDDHFEIRSILGNVGLAANGDCISQWELALESAASLADASVFGSGLAPLFTAAQAALSNAMHKAIEMSISMMVGTLVTGIFRDSEKDYASWQAQLGIKLNAVNLAALRPATLELASVFLFNDRVGVLMYDSGSFEVEDPRVYLALFKVQAGAPATVVDVGNWSQLNGFRAVGDYLLIDGKLIQNGAAAHQVKLIDVSQTTPAQYLLANADADVSYQFSSIVPINNGQQLAAMLSAPSQVRFIDLH